MERSFNSNNPISGSVLKWLAVFSMFIDHFALAILHYGRPAIQAQFFSGTDSALFAARAQLLYRIGRAIGRSAFPIFCFLLTEGFFRTRSRGRYLLRLGVFALLSEWPFDHALFPLTPADKQCNVYVTLFLGLCAIWAMEELSKRLHLPLARALGFGALAGACILAEVIHSDYGAYGVAVIACYYLCRDMRLWGNVLSYGILLLQNLSEAWALPGLALIQWYNGTRGRQSKYFYYFFYPGHLLLLYLVRTFWLKG